MTSQIQIFRARSILFTVCGPLVDTLISCKRLESPTFIKKPWSCWTLITGRKRRRSNNMEQETARDMVATGTSSNLRPTYTKLELVSDPLLGIVNIKT